MPPPTPGPVDVLVTREGQPVVGARVAFHDTHGALVGSTVTAGDGHARSDGPASAFTVLDPAIARALVTVTALPASDTTIEVALARQLDFTPPSTASLLVDAGPTPPPNVDGYGITTGCANTFVASLPTTIAIDARCIGASGGVPVIIQPMVMTNGLESNQAAIAYAAEIAQLDGGQFHATPHAWSTACAQVAVTNAGAAQLQFIQRRLDGIPLSPSDGFCRIEPTVVGQFQEPLLELDPPATAFIQALGLDNNTASSFKARHYATAPSAIDAPSDPDLISGSIGFGHLDARGMAWSASDQLTSLDAVVATANWRSDPAREDTSLSWSFIAPPTTTSVAIPETPPGFADVASMTPIGLEVGYYDATWLSGYADGVHALPSLLDPFQRGAQLPDDDSVLKLDEVFDAPP
jgi:hypothetical protein